MAKKKLRTMAEILLEMEELILEMTDKHGLQYGDVLNLVYGYMEVHCPEAKEVYVEDGSSPEFYYGPRRK